MATTQTELNSTIQKARIATLRRTISKLGSSASATDREPLAAELLQLLAMRSDTIRNGSEAERKFVLELFSIRAKTGENPETTLVRFFTAMANFMASHEDSGSNDTGSKVQKLVVSPRKTPGTPKTPIPPFEMPPQERTPPPQTMTAPPTGQPTKPAEVNKVETSRSVAKSGVRVPELFWPGPGQPRIDFETWTRIFEAYMQVSDYAGESEATKRNVLLLCLGTEGVKALAARPGDRTTLADDIESLRRYFRPVRTLLKERVDFIRIRQMGQESVEKLAERVRESANNCQFEILSEDLQLAQFVTAVRDDRI